LKNSIKEISQVEIEQVCGGLTYEEFNKYYNKLEEMCEDAGISVGYFLGSIIGFTAIISSKILSIIFPADRPDFVRLRKNG
jgi:hypothetical protein